MVFRILRAAGPLPRPRLQTAALLILLATAPSAGAAEVRIIRDNYGVPHIYASELGALFFGYGYGVAEDRLFQLEMMRRSVWGTVAEVLGPDYVDFDRRTRQLGRTRAEIRDGIARLPSSYRTMMSAYADGINRYIEICARSSAGFPAEFVQLGFHPSRWTSEDIAQLFVGSMAARHSDGTRELEYADLLEGLTRKFGKQRAAVIFDDLIPPAEPVDPVVTIPPSRKPSGTARRRPSDGIVPDNIGQVWRNTAAEESAYAQAVARLNLAPKLGSNCWIVGASRNDRHAAILMGGPQMGFTQPAYVHEVGLHGAGFDVVGATPAGYLPVLFGHNANTAWSSTAGGSDMVDIFVETLDPKAPSRYLFQGAWREMLVREETIHVKSANDVKTTFYRTVHGPVMAVDAAHHRAYARCRAWAGLELESMAAWIDKTQSSSFDDFLRAAHGEALTINWFYADRKGNIGYVHNGRYPIRNPAQDLRLPTSGTGDREWQGFLPMERNPHVLNPAQGFLANWNNQPAQGWFFAGGHWDEVDRGRTLLDFLQPKQTITLDDVRNLNRYAAFADTTWPYFRAELLAALRKMDRANATAARAADLLAQWDGSRISSDDSGRYDSPGVLIFQTWLTQTLANAFREDSVGPASAMLQFTPGDTPFGAKVLFRVLAGQTRGDYLRGASPADAMIAAFRTAVAKLAADLGPEPAHWRPPVESMVFRNRNFAQVPQSYTPETKLPAMNRGTQNHLVVLSATGVRGMNVVPPGESGRLNAQGRPGLHATDQLRLFADFEYKPMNFALSDVMHAAESEEILQFPQ